MCHDERVFMKKPQFVRVTSESYDELMAEVNAPCDNHCLCDSCVDLSGGNDTANDSHWRY